MRTKIFGNTGKEISILGFGCWGIGKSDWVGAEDNESKKVLIKAMNEGIIFFDTALAYGNGHSEILLGEAEKEFGKQVFIATKIPSKKREWPAGSYSLLSDSFPKKYIIEKTEESLRNLKRDHIDLQQFHVWNDKWAGEDEWKEAVTKLKKDGKVLAFGISVNDHQPENGIEAAKTGLISSIQVIFNIFEQKPADRLFPFAIKNKIEIIARVPFDEGALTGNINPATSFPKGDFRNGYFAGRRKMDVKLRADSIREDTKSVCDSNAEAALRYVVSFPAVSTVIPGMRKEKNLMANISYIKKGALPQELISRMRVHRWDKNFYE